MDSKGFAYRLWFLSRMNAFRVEMPELISELRCWPVSVQMWDRLQKRGFYFNPKSEFTCPVGLQ